MKVRIEKIVEASFQRIKEAYNGNSNGGIIFPNYTHGKKAGEIRVSEQELKCAFIEELREKEPNWYYSVETPTDKKYLFKGEPCVVPEEEEGGQSAQFDLTIYADSKGEKVLAHIEFKAHNPKEHDMKKDFLKLAEDKMVDTGIERVFIHLFKSFHQKTHKSIMGKLEECKTNNVHYLCYSIEEHEGKHKFEF